MAVLRQLNLLGQQRLDVPHIRALESSIAADFDVLGGRIIAGARPLVVRGFTLTNYTAGTPAVNVQLSVADAILMNIGASEAGTFLWVPSDRTAETLDPSTNARVSGGFTANQTNYIGLDLSRKADSTTSDLVQFLDANTLIEQPKTVPLARTLDYRIVISTVPFSAQPNIVPIAKIKTNSSNQVASLSTDVEDARNLAFRLGSGGDFPNRSYGFAWSDGRVEFNTVTGATVNQFRGGDKVIQSQKDWMDAVMTRIWEVGGGENWYSPTADRNVRMSRDPSPNVFATTGDNFEFVSSNLHWRGLSFLFENSNGTSVFKNTVADQLTDSAGLTDITPGQCIYVDLDRTSNAAVTAHKANLWQLGSPTIPGSRIIIAWCVSTGVIMTRDAQFPVNTALQPATTTVVGGVRLSYAAGTPATPTVIPLDANLTLNVGTGVNGVPVGNVPSLVVTGNSGNNAAQTITPTTGGHGLEVFAPGSSNKSAIRARRTFTNTAAGHFGEDYDMALNSFYAPLLTVTTSAGNALGVIAEVGGGVGAYIKANYPIYAQATTNNTGQSEIRGFFASSANVAGGLALKVQGGGASSGNAAGGDALIVTGGAGVGTGAPGRGIVVTLLGGGTGNQTAITSTGVGTGAGGYFVGGGTTDTQFAPNGDGILSWGGGAGSGIYARGGNSGGTGVYGEGGGANSIGVQGLGKGTGAGASFVGGSGGIGASIVAGGGNSNGLNVNGTGTGLGIQGFGGPTGNGADFYANATYSGVTAPSVSNWGLRGRGVYGLVGSCGTNNGAGVYAWADNGSGQALLAINNTSGYGAWLQTTSGAGGLPAVNAYNNSVGPGLNVRGGSLNDDARPAAIIGAASGGGLKMAGGNASTGTAYTNTLMPNNVPKAWVQCHSDGAGNMVIDAGFNIASIAITSGARFVITFAQAMANANFACVVTPSNAGGEICCVTSKTSSTVTIDIPAKCDNTGSPITWSTPPAGGFLLNTANKFYNVVVFGLQ